MIPHNVHALRALLCEPFCEIAVGHTMIFAEAGEEAIFSPAIATRMMTFFTTMRPRERPLNIFPE